MDVNYLTWIEDKPGGTGREDVPRGTHSSTDGGCLGAGSNGRVLWYSRVGGGGAFFTQYPIATKSGDGCCKGAQGGGDQRDLETGCWPKRCSRVGGGTSVPQAVCGLFCIQST
jgi:hypothetical protein